MPKFKVGDRVRCINIDSDVLYQLIGVGWKENLVYTIQSKWIPDNDPTSCVYYGGWDGHGVYEPFLELVSIEEWDK